MSNPKKIKILIADDDRQLSRRTSDYLNSQGFECETVENGREAREVIMAWGPRLVLADLMLPEGNALELADFIRQQKNLSSTFCELIILSGHSSTSNVKEAYARGAKDYIVKPFKYEDLVSRLAFSLRETRQLKNIQQKDFERVDENSVSLHLLDLMLKQALDFGNLPDTLLKLTQMVALKLKGVRCSIVEFVDPSQGYVVVSHDSKNATGLKLDLNKYPEILNVVNTEHLMAVDNLDESLHLAEISQNLKSIDFNSMIVCPVYQYGQVFGVLSLRLPRDKKRITDNEIRYMKIAAKVISLVLSTQNQGQISTFWKQSA